MIIRLIIHKLVKNLSTLFIRLFKIPQLSVHRNQTPIYEENMLD